VSSQSLVVGLRHEVYNYVVWLYSEGHFECFPHSPYSPNLAPSNYHVWATPRGSGRKEVPYWWIGTAAGAWVVAQTTTRFLSRGIRIHCKCWRACIERIGDYVEKWRSCVPLSANKLNFKNAQGLRFSRRWLWRVASSEMLRRVALVRTEVSEELSASFIRVTRICELGKTLSVTSNRRTLRWNFFSACVSC
jgi:hypothetical protein